MLNEQAIMEAKRRSQTGSKLTGHNSACIRMISLPKLKKLENMCTKVSISTARQFKACDQLRDKIHVSTSLTDLLQGSAGVTAKEPAQQSRYVALHVMAACREAGRSAL